jgi:FAD synthase
LRDEQRFASVDDLVSQIEDDIAVARSILGGSIRP